MLRLDICELQLVNIGRSICERFSESANVTFDSSILQTLQFSYKLRHFLVVAENVPGGRLVVQIADLMGVTGIPYNDGLAGLLGLANAAWFS